LVDFFILKTKMAIGFWPIGLFVIGISYLAFNYDVGKYFCHHSSTISNPTNSIISPILATNISITGLCPVSSIVRMSYAQVIPGKEQAFEYRLSETKLIEHARNFPGNVYYFLLHDNGNKSLYRFVESWANISVLYTWLAAYPKIVFDNKTNNLLIGGGLSFATPYGYTQLEDCNNQGYGIGSVRFKVNCSCNHVWKTMNDINNCQWIYSCKNVQVINSTKRILIFDSRNLNQDILQNNNNTYTYSYRLDDVYEGTTQLTNDTLKSCMMDYTFNASKSYRLTVDQTYDEIYNKRTPHIQNFFNCG